MALKIAAFVDFLLCFVFGFVCACFEFSSVVFKFFFLLSSTDGRSNTELNPALPKEIQDSVQYMESVYKIVYNTWKVFHLYGQLTDLTLLWKKCVLSLVLVKKIYALLFLASLNAIYCLNGSKQCNIKGKPVSFPEVFDTKHMEFLSYCTVV